MHYNPTILLFRIIKDDSNITIGCQKSKYDFDGCNKIKKRFPVNKENEIISNITCLFLTFLYKYILHFI